MLTILFLMLAGALLGGGLTTLAASAVLRRQQRAQLGLLQQHIARQVGMQVGRSVAPVLQTASKLTQIVAQIQESQGRQHEQLHKLADVSLLLKKELTVLAARQAADYEADSEFAAITAERPRYLN